MDTIEIGEAVTTDKGTYRVRLEQDDTPESPRDFDSNAGIIVADLHDYYMPKEGDYASEIMEMVQSGGTLGEIATVLRLLSDTRPTVLPLYKGYGDDTLLIGRADDTPYEIGELVGVIYDGTDTAREERRVDPCSWDADAALRIEVEEYNRWARGEVYGYIVERQIPACDHCGCEARWEVEESVWGHIGSEYAEQAAREALSDFLAG